MDIINNITHKLGDDLKASLKGGDRLKVAASCFSIFAFEALKGELEKLEKLEFIFTAPTFVPETATDEFKREQREFFIPKVQRERSLYGSEFEIQLRNKLTQRAVARECADWTRQKATFRSNKTRSPMQQFVCVEGADRQVAYMPVNGFTAVDLGYQKGNAVSNIVNRFSGVPYTNTYLELFDQIWADPEKVEDVTDAICQHIESVYHMTDSGNERRFVEELDTSSEVVVYAKLPRGFLIPTPVGDYNPDWAISLKRGSVKHIYFVAETKGSMSSMKLREIERKKIDCARKFFDEVNEHLTAEKVKYEVVTDIAKLMDLVCANAA